VVDADQTLATLAGHLRAATAEAGLSLGDRFSLALARRDGLLALTADRQWRSIADAVGVEVLVIR
jgi:ribonuclease VapC